MQESIKCYFEKLEAGMEKQVKYSIRAKIRSILTSPRAATLLYRFVLAYCLTFRLRVENEKTWLNYLKEGGKILLCGWHQQFFATLRYCDSLRVHRPSVMISQSQDGELIAGIFKKCGWFPVRGSSSRGGGQALKMMIEKLKETGLAAHIVDGPRGPAGKVKDGVIRLAQATGAVIVPFYISADRAWYFNSWDRFLVPKPFARATLSFGDMIKLSFTENQDELEKQRQSLENTMLPSLINTAVF
ncbi:MAG: hypothetical protein COX51_09550 [Syntrophobacteraceae bacterium CG23_combo_of_CG06-09_8_20_14_all_50_8]|nr:MAG: hypothetical protein COX51_09550 [Syntrophobacteraceae bacterium CG23_combo_of_CG06-09_8_20_14_all_50_8]